MKKCSLPKNLPKNLGLYLVSLEGYLSGTMKNRRWGAASDGISHQRLFKVINQGHVTEKGRFN